VFAPRLKRAGIVHTGTAAGALLLGCAREPLPRPRLEIVAPDTASSFEEDFGLVTPSQPSHRHLAPQVHRRRDCANPRSSAFYFPVGTFRGPNQPHHYDVDASDREYVSAILRAIDEPSLSCRDRRSTDLRLVWIRNLRQPVVVRVSIPADQSFEPYVLVDAPGYDGGSLIERHYRALNRTDRRALVASLESTSFWTMPSAFDPPFPDADSLVVEARVGAAYHLVGRRLAARDRFRELGELLMELGGLPLPQD
jgi:hypothetical protein